MAAQLGYSEEQLNILLEEVAERYQSDRGQQLLEAAFSEM
jgi:hypothetical protein